MIITQKLLEVNPNIYKKEDLRKIAKVSSLLFEKNYGKSYNLKTILTIIPALSPYLGDYPDTPYNRHRHVRYR